MTPEREAEIRESITRGDVWERAVGELLAMLDRERAEIDRLRAYPQDRDALLARAEAAEADAKKARVMLNDVTGRAFGDDAYIIGLEKRAEAAEAFAQQLIDRIARGNEIAGREADALLARAEAAEAARDMLAAALAEMREAAQESVRAKHAYNDMLDCDPDSPERNAILDRTIAGDERWTRALAAIPVDLAAQRDARVHSEGRHKALREAADAYDRGDMLTSDLSAGLGAWLRAMAEEEGKP